ncbi:MAG: hypothetical protein U0271_43465 [Polyangiaceae bacterium]
MRRLSLIPLGALWMGCADPSATANEAARLYATPLAELDPSDCTGSLERATRAQTDAQPKITALKAKVARVASNDQFQANLISAINSLQAGSRDFPLLCLKEARAIHTMLRDNAKSLGLVDVVDWFDASPSKETHVCVRGPSCEENLGVGRSQAVVRQVCESVDGAWKLGSCPRGGALGACRFDPGGETERLFFTYGKGDTTQSKRACEEPPNGRERGKWEPLAESAPAAASAAPSALPANAKPPQTKQASPPRAPKPAARPLGPPPAPADPVY